jgi:hypothetical protein
MHVVSMFSCSITLVDIVGKEMLASTEFTPELSHKVMAVKCKILANGLALSARDESYLLLGQPLEVKPRHKANRQHAREQLAICK